MRAYYIVDEETMLRRLRRIPGVGDRHEKMFFPHLLKHAGKDAVAVTLILGVYHAIELYVKGVDLDTAQVMRAQQMAQYDEFIRAMLEEPTDFEAGIKPLLDHMLGRRSDSNNVA